MKQYPQSFSIEPQHSSIHNGTIAEHRGILVVIFGVLGIVTCGLFGIAAWIIGTSDLAKMDSGRMDPSGRSLTNTGRICGIIATGIFVVQLAFGLLSTFYVFFIRQGGNI